MNKWIGIGRLTADPTVTESQQGTTIARYRLACDRPFKKDGQPSADFISCVAFGKGGEFAEKYLHKGMRIAVEGRIQTGDYEKDGEKRYTFDVVVDRHEFCDSKGTAPSENQNQGFVDVSNDIDDLPFF